MTTLTAGARPPRSLLGGVIGAVQRSPRARKHFAAAVSLVRDHVTTVAAFAAADFGVFQISHAAAWIVGAGLGLILEWKIRD